MSALTVNLDMVALLRAVRRLGEPDPAQAAVLSEVHGADGIAVQLRRDKKYIRDRDLYLLKGVVKTKLTFEMPPTEDAIERALEIKPWMVTFAADHADSDSPISPIELTGADIDFSEIVNRLDGMGINAGFFIDPDVNEIKAADKMGASSVLLNCSGFTEAKKIDDARREIDRIDKATDTASKCNMAVYAGRGINYKNIQPLAELDNIDEFFIGHAIVTRALLVGFEAAVKEMLNLIGKSSRQ